jgi:predicted Zn-dependent protease
MAADAYAAKLLHDAGLDPAALLAYLRTLPAQQSKELSVYPEPAERIGAAQAAIAGLGR